MTRKKAQFIEFLHDLHMIMDATESLWLAAFR